MTISSLTSISLDPPLDGNAGVNPGLSRNCHRGVDLRRATADRARLEGGGEQRSGSQDAGGGYPRGWIEEAGAR